MTDGTTTTTGDTTTTTTTTTPPWHDGIDASLIGWAQNKGYKLESPKDAFSAAAKQAFEAEKHFSAPPDRIIRLPEKPDDLAGWNSVYTKLGVPADAKDYDFTGIKRADNTDVPAALADNLRAAMLTARVPKDRGPDVVKAVIKSLDDTAAQEATVHAGKVAELQADLKKSWGPNYDYNLLKAIEGARRIGLSKEGMTALENQIGGTNAMEAMRKIGQGTSEDTFVDGNRGPGGHPTTLEGAKSKLAELEADKSWGKRLKDKDPATIAEWRTLTAQISAAEAA